MLISMYFKNTIIFMSDSMLTGCLHSQQTKHTIGSQQHSCWFTGWLLGSEIISKRKIKILLIYWYQ